MRLFAAAVLILAAVAVNAEEPGSDTPYRKYYDQLASAKAADSAGALRIRMCPKPAHDGESLPADLAFEIRDGAQRTPLPLDAQRCFELPANSAWAEHDASLHKNFNSPIKAVVDMTGRLPSSTQLRYAELTASVPAFVKVMASQGMLARMFGPKVKGLVLRFAPAAAQTVTVHAADGDRTFTTDANGIIRMPVDPALDDARVELSSLPLEIGPDA